MTLLTHRGEGPAFSYAGQPMHVLAGQGGLPPGFAAMELTIPPHFAGPIPHAHDEFDEAIYVLSGRLRVHGDDEPRDAVPGSLFVAPRGHRHGFSNPSGEGALGAGNLSAAGTRPGLHARDRRGPSPRTPPPDPERMREICARHASRLLPQPLGAGHIEDRVGNQGRTVQMDGVAAVHDDVPGGAPGGQSGLERRSSPAYPGRAPFGGAEHHRGDRGSGAAATVQRIAGSLTAIPSPSR